jgi:hypothetical protein
MTKKLYRRVFRSKITLSRSVLHSGVAAVGIATATSQLHFPASHGVFLVVVGTRHIFSSLSFTASGLRGGFGGSGQEISPQPNVRTAAGVRSSPSLVAETG